MIHLYNGGGVDAYGPALLVRKSIADRVSLAGTYYIDAVSNASIDVVTTASKYKEIAPRVRPRRRLRLPRLADHVSGGGTSHEPDYTANPFSLDLTQEVFGGMTTVALGFTRGADKVGKKGSPEFSRHGAALAVPARRHADPHARAGSRAPTSRRCPTTATSAARTGWRACSAPPCPERNPRTRTAARSSCRASSATSARATAMHAELPLLLRHLGHHGHTAEARLQPLLRRQLAGRRLPALLHPDHAPRSTATTRRARPSTSRAIASSAPSTTPASAPRWRTRSSSVPGKYNVKLNGAVRVHALQVQGLHRPPHRQHLLLQRQRPAAVRDGHLLTTSMSNEAHADHRRLSGLSPRERCCWPRPTSAGVPPDAAAAPACR